MFNSNYKRNKLFHFLFAFMVPFLSNSFLMHQIVENGGGNAEDKTDLIIEKVKAAVEIPIKDLNEKIKSIQEKSNGSEATQKAIDELSKAVIKQGEVLALIKNENTPKIDNKTELRKSIKEAAEKLKTQTNGMLTVKVAAAMTEATNLTGEIPQSQREPGYTNVVRQLFILRNSANVGATNSNLVSYVEQVNPDGAAAVTSEGNAKPLIDWDYKENQAKVFKIAGRVRVSREMLNDLSGIEAEINGELMYRLQLAEETNLLTGNGTTAPMGVTTHADSVDLAALANSVKYANQMDAIYAAITQIYVKGKGQFVPNLIFVNPVDKFKMLSQKNDSEHDYQMPIFTMPDGTTLAGVTLVESVTIPAGYFLVGDFRYFNVRDKETEQILMGYDSDDFSKNMVTIIAEKRFASFVKENHYSAFVYSSFANVIAYITVGS